jgi:hypothetical protein
MLYQVLPPSARKPLDLDPVGIPLDTAIALSGLSKPIIYCAAARGDVTLYRGDGGVVILDYRDLRPLLHSLPPWTPPKRRIRKPAPNNSEDFQASEA